MDFIRNNKRSIIIAITIIVAASAIYIIYENISRMGKYKVDVYAAPASAKTLFRQDGNTITTTQNNAVWLKPGSYEVETTKDGFEAVSQTIEVRDQPIASGYLITAGLRGLTDEAIEYTKTHNDEYLLIEKYKGAYMNTRGAIIRDKFPIISSLPYKDPYYTIGYTQPDENHIIINIYTESPYYRNEAIRYISSLGYNPSDYKIVFVDYKSPIGGSNES